MGQPWSCNEDNVGLGNAQLTRHPSKELKDGPKGNPQAERIRFLELLAAERLKRLREIEVMTYNEVKEGASAEELLDVIARIGLAASAPPRVFMEGC